MYSSLDARSTSLARDLLTRPACGRPNARTRRLNHPRHVVSLHVPSRRRRTCGRPCDLAPVTGRARNERQRVRYAHAPTRQHGKSSSPGSSPRRDRHRARDHRSAAAGRGRVTRSLPLVFLSPLSVDRRRGAPSSSSKRSARVQLCWHISYRGGRGGRGGRGLMQRITFVGARPAAGR